MKERSQPEPTIIEILNESMRKGMSDPDSYPTVEGIAERVGFHRNILYEWAESDAEFTTALDRLKDIQKDDSFKTVTDEDICANAMMIALLLIETGIGITSHTIDKAK